jgi:hypothetical protein
MRLFADRVVPVLQRDPAFAAPVKTATADVAADRSTGVFAPA